MIEPPKYRRYFAEWLQVNLRRVTSVQALLRMEVRSYEDHLLMGVVHDFTVYLAAMPKERIEVHKRWPKDWWQAFRERWLPQWWLRRWPVEYEQVDIDQQIYLAVCPHVDADPQRQHLEWLAAQHDAFTVVE